MSFRSILCDILEKLFPPEPFDQSFDDLANGSRSHLPIRKQPIADNDPGLRLFASGKLLGHPPPDTTEG